MSEKFVLPQCSCGREHLAAIDDIIIGNGVIARLPELIRKYEAKKPFILTGCRSYEAAGKQVEALLRESGVSYSIFKFEKAKLEPDEQAVGSAVMHFDPTCDLIIGVGSGVINDIGKILSSVSGRKYIIVCTAPSMDGYASSTSSVALDGLKVSIKSRCADVIIGDIDILKAAPDQMLKAGLGDMAAKYISIAEWRISHIVTGEYYCENIARLVRSALSACVDNAPGLLKREDGAVQAVFDGLVTAGIAMAYAGVSRPASGTEHYFSHIWDMRALAFGMGTDLHGIQCAVGTALSAKLYDIVREISPEEDKAEQFVRTFDYDAWCSQLRSFLGKGSEAMILQETVDGKYRRDAHATRFCRIRDNWSSILQIIREEIPSYEAITNLLDLIGIEHDYRALGIDQECVRLSFKATKDIRDKYVLSRLAWDLGILEELSEAL